MATNDGSGNAPAGAPQIPTLLNGYAAQLSSQLADIDYAVGIPSGPSLKNPIAISMAGMSVKSMKLAEFSTWAQIGVDVTMPALPLAAAKKGGAVPDWTHAALGLFTMNDLADDAITHQKFWDLIQDPNGGHFHFNSVERGPGTVIDVPASKIGEVSGTVSHGLQAQLLDDGGGRAGDAALTVGTAMTISSVAAATPVGTTGLVAEPVSNARR